MLLSFPLDASSDVLEIISDSVYANSSTLDGRRFANEYASRRKTDVAARYPSIVMSKTTIRIGGKPSSMAEALKSQPVAKTPEWSVKVAGGKKKKGGK
jgi:PERQ amino acid-rich with GYF domain-containing protein